MSLVLDGTAGITFNNATTQASAGCVLQVIQGTLTGYVRTTSTSLVDTGITATITPKFSTSKILVLVNCNDVGKETANTYLKLQIIRGSTSIYNMGDLISYTNTTGDTCIGSVDGNFLDSPATTSATTYKVQYANGGGSGGVYVNWYGSSNTCQSSITLMEIAQ